MTNRNRDCAEQSFVHSYDDWWDQLDGKPSALPASRVGLGFYAKRERDGSHVGVAIWLAENHPVAKVGHGSAPALNTAALEEDFSFSVLAWCMAVPEEAYVAWAANGVWPEGTQLDRPKPKREKPAAAAPAPPAPPAVEQHPEPATGNVFVRFYQTIDPPSPALAFMARAIARAKGGGEGFSVGFYGADVAEAEGKARAWITAERQKAERADAAREARAAIRRRQPTPADQPVTEGASA